LKYFLLLLLLVSQYSLADCEQESDRCAPIGEWEFALSVGAGVSTNPLNGGDNIPLILIPEISYYGDKVFFENNTLGYTFFESQKVVVSAITKLNPENAYFSRWHPKNIFLDSLSSSTSAPINTPDSSENTPGNGFDQDSPIKKVNIDDVESKRWAIDAGVQVNWFINETTDFEVQILHDINNVYNGFTAQFQFSQIMKINQLPETTLLYSLGANINDKNLVDYFYGIPAEENSKNNPIYKGELSFNPFLRLELIHQFSSSWSARLTLKSLFLGKGTSDSPLVKDNHTETIFAGVTYDF
jgi:outer membrane protein